MYLYHGTSSKRLERILSQGILPAGIGGDRVWVEDPVRSKDGLVYLSRAFAAYYANAAAAADGDKDTKPVILQVDMEQLGTLYPDEDFIAIAMARENGGRPRDYNERIDPRDFAIAMPKCFATLGSVCTEGVPPEAILGHVVVPDFVTSCYLGGDLVLGGEMAFKFLGAAYEQRLESLFDKGLSYIEQEMQAEHAEVSDLLSAIKNDVKRRGK